VGFVEIRVRKKGIFIKIFSFKERERKNKWHAPDCLTGIDKGVYAWRAQASTGAQQKNKVADKVRAKVGLQMLIT